VEPGQKTRMNQYTMKAPIIYRQTIFLLIVFGITQQTKAEIKPANIFSDHMVVQQKRETSDWGWANPGEKVTVSLNSKSASVSTGKDGKWLISLPSQKAVNPFQLKMSGKNKIVLNDVMISEVWLCAGQSNMAHELKDDLHGKEEVQYNNRPIL
jgi:sialate O-acetylesterase